MSTKNKGKAPTPQQADGMINIDDMVAKARAGIPAQMQPMYDKVTLQGMRIIFDARSHQMTIEHLDGEGPMAEKLASGIIAIMYMLWTESNKTIPPQLMVPVTLTLTLRAFQFLQMSQDPEATRETLGEATAGAVQGLMDRFGATADKLPALLKSQGGAQKPGAPAAPQAGGMLAGGKP